MKNVRIFERGDLVYNRTTKHPNLVVDVSINYKTARLTRSPRTMLGNIVSQNIYIKDLPDNKKAYMLDSLKYFDAEEISDYIGIHNYTPQEKQDILERAKNLRTNPKRLH